mmetsp:Transcript_84346/g.239086  ORF Transcript_84346/g.239086 Transcript_84346/m.239086 type:complete len:279 (+) Transcript_84346:186-1022(+)
MPCTEAPPAPASAAAMPRSRVPLEKRVLYTSAKMARTLGSCSGAEITGCPRVRRSRSWPWAFWPSSWSYLRGMCESQRRHAPTASGPATRSWCSQSRPSARMAASTDSASSLASRVAARLRRCRSPWRCSNRASCVAASGAIWENTGCSAAWPMVLQAYCLTTGLRSVTAWQAGSMNRFQQGTLSSPRQSTRSSAIYIARPRSSSLALGCINPFRNSKYAGSATSAKSVRFELMSERAMSARQKRSVCLVAVASSASPSVSESESLLASLRPRLLPAG